MVNHSTMDTGLKMKRKYKGDSDYVPCVIYLKRIGDVPKKVVSKDDRKVN